MNSSDDISKSVTAMGQILVRQMEESFAKVIAADQIIAIKDSEDCDLPSYSEVGRILVRLFNINLSVVDRSWKYELEVLDHDGCAFWISEGIGFEYWLEDCEFPHEGDFVVEGIVGHYYKGDGWETDDDEEWEWSNIREATRNETINEVLE